MSKATKRDGKRHNTQLILRQLYQQGEMSRADIARSTKLTRPTVSSIVGELIADNLVAETRIGKSTGGKRPVMLTVAEDSARLLCVDIGSQIFRGGLLDLRGNIVQHVTLPAEDVQGDDALQLLYRLIDELVAAATRPLLGIAVGTPGLIDPRSGVVRRAVNFDWTDVPLRQLLRERYDRPIHLANDSHAAALAEHLYGPEKQGNVVLLKTGRGIGAGIVWKGAMLVGDGFGAGEVGQLVVAERDGELLTLEDVASTGAILRRARALDSADLGWQAIFDSPALPTLIEEVGHYLGIAVANFVTLLNIHHIAITGRMSQFGTPLLTKIMQTANRYTLPTLVEGTQVRFSELGEEIVLLGCSALILKHELGIF